MKNIILPLFHKIFLFNSFSSNLNCSYNNDSNYQYYQDNYNVLQPPPLMSTAPLINFSNSHNLKPSNTIEQLQMFLENPNNCFNHRQSSSYGMYSLENSNNAQWSSSNTSMHTNQTFTCNDAEQLLSFVRNLRN